VHLVWAPLGTAPLRRFAESYARYAAGVDHRLLILFNGFRPDQDLAPWQRCLEHVRHEALRIESPVLDLAAYRQAVELVPAARYCFLNSYSVIRADGWLELMRAAASARRVGAVGASGSWGSQFSHVRYAFGLGGPYREVFGDRRSANQVFTGLSAHTRGDPVPTGFMRRALTAAHAMFVYSRAFPSFPSPHLRTNCLLIDRDLWLRVSGADPRDKLAAYRVESGRRSLTARITAMGLRVVVVGRDGCAYESPEWPRSETFWQGNQENLLVEDNQTRTYLDGDAEVRRLLSAYAWGRQSDPAGARVPEVT
jgi:hypothetical protein